MLPKEVDFPAQIDLGKTISTREQSNVFTSIQVGGERKKTIGVRME